MNIGNTMITIFSDMMNDKWSILIYLLMALIVTQVPYVRVYSSLCNTLIRDIIRVILEGRKTKKKNLPINHLIQKKNFHFKNTLIMYAGYTGESLAAIGLFYLVSNQNFHLILYLLIVLIVVGVVLSIRNLWLFLWALSFIVLLSFPLYFKLTMAIMHMSIFLASLLLIQSIINGIRVCRQSLLKQKDPARSGIFSKLKLIPTILLGIILLGQSLYTGYFIAKNILSFY